MWLRAQHPLVAHPCQELCSGTFHFPECSLHSPHPKALLDLQTQLGPSSDPGKDLELRGREIWSQ